MKKLAFTFLLGLISLTISAQKTIEKSFVYTNQLIDVDVKFARNIKVKTWDKNTVYFKADIQIEGGKFHELFELNIIESSNALRITSEADEVFTALRQDCLKNYPDKKRECYVTGDLARFNYVLYVPKNAKFKISSINGDVVSDIIEGSLTADLINGDIDIKTYSGSLDLSTINGAIDLRMIDANLVAETIHGNIYADEKLKFYSEDKYVGQKISGRTADGKNVLRLNTINGDMYLRL